MTLEGLIANYRDLQRLKKLEKQGKFKSGFAAEAQQRSLAYLIRICELAAIDRVKPYDGPIDG